MVGTPGRNRAPSTHAPSGQALVVQVLQAGGEAREGPGPARITGRASHTLNGSAEWARGLLVRLGTSDHQGWGWGLTPWRGNFPVIPSCSCSLDSAEVGGRCCSVTQSCPTLCNPTDCSTPGLPVHHQLLELAQTHVHRVGDAIQPSHPLSTPSSPHQR